MFATCYQCHVPFETSRTDACFCSGACKAEYYRNVGDTDKHADKPNFDYRNCPTCGNIFWFNAYAARGGQRRPTYCSDKCRVKAHRIKQKWARNNGAPPGYTPPQPPPTSAQPPPPQPPPTGDFRDNLPAPTRLNRATWYLWLGVNIGSSESVCKDAVRSLNKTYHPDVNGGVIWPHLASVNAAWSYLKKCVFRHSP